MNRYNYYNQCNRYKHYNRYSRINLILSIVTMLCVGWAGSAEANTKLKMCAFTLAGTTGPDYRLMEAYRAEALSWGAQIELKTYVNEKVVADDLLAGQCDIASMSAAKAAKFNLFASSIGAVGAVPSYEHLRLVMAALASDKASKYLRKEQFEVIGIQPAGAIFLFLRDRYLRGVEDLAGRKMGVLESMPEMRNLVTDMGMTPVNSTVSNIFQKFNNGNIDITGSPAIAYELMELYKGLSDTGGVIEYPLLQGSVQLIAYGDKLPQGFAQKSRQYFLDNFDESLSYIKKAEASIPRKYWMPLPDCNRREMDAMNRDIRLSLLEKGVYDPKMLTLLRKVRCKIDATRPECTDPNAE